MENAIIKQVVGTKFLLGIIIDQHLSWKSHISFVSKKISKTVGIIATELAFIYHPNRC